MDVVHHCCNDAGSGSDGDLLADGPKGHAREYALDDGFHRHKRPTRLRLRRLAVFRVEATLRGNLSIP